ncbi:MAG: M48 family metallopeptidase [Clostridia bacterium]|nr:M48 family metallopeptidase [Clostridia bacterium]
MEPQYILIRNNIKNLYIQIKDSSVIVKAPKRFSEKQIETILKEKQKWIEKNLQNSIKKQEREEKYTIEEFTSIVEQNVKELIILTGLKPNRVRIKQIKYAWGSCSSSKNITINRKLICYSQNAIRYVILHELCHLKYMNHSKDFWNLVATYMPNYKEAKKELKD